MGFSEWLESPHLFLVMEGTSETSSFICPSFRRRNRIHGKEQLAGAFKASWWLTGNWTQLAGSHLVPFAGRATDQSTTGWVILARHS